jgi:hypothetical protein
MKTTASKFALTLFTLAMFFSFSAFAGSGNESKKAAKWQTEFKKRINYGNENKELLRESVVFLEVHIDETGKVTIENFNSNNKEAADYVIKKLNGIKLNNSGYFNTRFIVKYSFK